MTAMKGATDRSRFWVPAVGAHRCCGDFAFLGALGGGQTMAEALAARLAPEPGFDLTATLMPLIKSNIVVGLHLPDPINGPEQSAVERCAKPGGSSAGARALRQIPEPTSE